VRVAIPADEGLPQIAVLLDADAMALTLARSLGRDQPLAPVDVRYLRYRPGKNLCVHYAVCWDIPHSIRRLPVERILIAEINIEA